MNATSLPSTPDGASSQDAEGRTAQGHEADNPCPICERPIDGAWQYGYASTTGEAATYHRTCWDNMKRVTGQLASDGQQGDGSSRLPQPAPLINQIKQQLRGILLEYHLAMKSNKVADHAEPAIQRILTAFDTFLGEDEKYNDKDWLEGYAATLSDVQRMNYGRNHLRAELRAKLKKEGM